MKELLGKLATHKKDKMLDIFIKARTGRVLDKTVNKSRDYQNALKQQDIALNKMNKAGLNQKQKLIVDRAISSANNCGAVYGAAAYRLGLHDGIKVMSEIKEILPFRKSVPTAY